MGTLRIYLSQGREQSVGIFGHCNTLHIVTLGIAHMWSGYLSNCVTNTEVYIWESQTTHVCTTIIYKDRYLTDWPLVVMVVISGHMLRSKFIGNSRKIALKWMPQNTFDDKSTLNSDNGLVPSGNSFESMLIQIYLIILCLKVTWSLIGSFTSTFESCYNTIQHLTILHM